VDPLDDNDICPGEDGCEVGAVTVFVSGGMSCVGSCLLSPKIGEVVGERLCNLLFGWLVGRVVMCRVVLSDVLGSKDVVEERDERTDGRTRRIVIGRIRVKTELHAQIRFYVLSLINTVG
jgi:hypothetical protein